ncbi:acyltransferase family protein [Methylobacterium sp. J-068]|uniref:acyltransferase family protein n=1 Tax=Methylobacterium sp. J-068 TaxID=2836649 RepID=UPI001FBA3435|nr:acyltransferase [Methylobacterium sp. J-068]MCJ2033957.1 acyltransferase [Methylobacterium sp. J-068]
MEALTGVRYIAAALVVLHHFVPVSEATDPIVRNFLKVVGDGSVSVFFVLSGIVLFHSNVTLQGRLKKTKRHFWIARFARIYPVYALGILLIAPLSVHQILSSHPNATNYLPRLIVYPLSAISLLQSWTPWTAVAWNGPAWSLSVEAFFYALFPLLIGIASLSRRTCLAIALSSWALASAIGMAPFVLWGDAGSVFGGIFFQAFPPLRLPEFIVGLILGILIRDTALPDAARSALSLVAVASLTAATLFAPWWAYRFFSLPCIGLLLFGLTSSGGILTWVLKTRVLVSLGAASYSLYILHVPVFGYLGLIQDSLSFRPLGPVANVFFGLALLTALSVACHRYLEMPMAGWINGRLASRPGQRRDAPAVDGATAEASLRARMS